MGYVAVSAALHTFLQGVPGITTLYEDAPFELLGDNWQTNGLPGTPAFLHINSTDETRLTTGMGSKEVTYDVSLVMLYQWWIPNDLTGVGKDGWRAGLHQLLDAVKNKIRSDPSFGCAGGSPIWSAGNKDNDIAVHSDLPHWDQAGGKVMAWNRVDFKATEIVQGA